MPLDRVTITGADDSVKPWQLVALFEEFPFVEWGILIGSSTGPRFPSLQWIYELVDVRANDVGSNRMPLALHVCGQYLRDIAIGGTRLQSFLDWQLGAFGRVQLNWHGEMQPSRVGENVLTAFCKMDGFGWDPTLIFQLDGVNDCLFEPASRRFACVGLFDRSHGAGVAPGEWPKAREDIACGWAGGLGPDNLAAEIPRINACAWPALNYWIDMETGVRSDCDSRFDLGKVRECLEICRPFVAAPANG